MTRYLIALLLVFSVAAGSDKGSTNYGYGPAITVVEQDEDEDTDTTDAAGYKAFRNSELADAVYEANFEDRLFSSANGFHEVGIDRIGYSQKRNQGKTFHDVQLNFTEYPAAGQGYQHIPGERPRIVTPSRSLLASVDRSVVCGFAGAGAAGPRRPDQFLDCPTPIKTAFSNIGDLRGHWARRVAVGPMTLQRVERIEQCEDRVVISTNEMVHDFVHADGSFNMGVDDVKESSLPSCKPYKASGTWDDGCLEIRVRKQVVGKNMPHVLPPDEVYCRGKVDPNILRVYSHLGWTTLYRVNEKGEQIYEHNGVFGFPHVVPRIGEPDHWGSSERRQPGDGSRSPLPPKVWEDLKDGE